MSTEREMLSPIPEDDITEIKRRLSAAAVQMSEIKGRLSSLETRVTSSEIDVDSILILVADQLRGGLLNTKKRGRTKKKGNTKRKKTKKRKNTKKKHNKRRN